MCDRSTGNYAESAAALSIPYRMEMNRNRWESLVENCAKGRYETKRKKREMLKTLHIQFYEGKCHLQSQDRYEFRSIMRSPTLR